MSGKTFECPNCGAAVRVGKLVCRECGSDDATGWMSSDEIDYQSIDIPDGYGQDDLVGDGQLEQRGKAWVTVVAVLLVIVLVLVFALRI